MLNDFLSHGICPPVVPALNPFNWLTTPCVRDSNFTITEGVCSNLTENLLGLRKECGFVIRQQSALILQTLAFLLTLMCRTVVVENFFDSINIETQQSNDRLVPLELVYEFQDATVATDLKLGILSS